MKIFSPADINTFIVLLNNAVNNSIPLGNIFGGMLASDPDTNYNIYQIHYIGNGSDIPGEYTEDEVEDLKIWYRGEAQQILDNNGDGALTHSDMQKLLFNLFKKMNVKSVVLAKIEDNPSKTKIVNFSNSGTPSEQTCP